MIKQLINGFLGNFGLRVIRISNNAKEPIGKVGFIQHRGRRQGNALLSYINEPFLLKNETSISNAHHNHWLSWQIGQTFSSLGYDVDVVHYLDDKFIPQKNYDFLIGARTNFQRLSQLMPSRCVKIVHLDTAHWLFNNGADYKRHFELQKRRGVALESFKWVEPNWALEYADYATTNWGNQFNVGTYHFANKKIFQIPLPTCAVFPKPKNKDYTSCRRHFLWFGSTGLVHKGLDLVLEAFSQMPEYRLTVCGPVRQKDQGGDHCPLWYDSQFEDHFHQELYESPNICTKGWVDIEGEAFHEIINNCIGIIFPSCSEGGGASVITCMQAGLIPIVNYETNVEVADFGFKLPNCSIQTIKQTIHKISRLPEQDLRNRSHKAWQFSRTYHTRQKFKVNYCKVIEQIMSECNMDIGNSSTQLRLANDI